MSSVLASPICSKSSLISLTNTKGKIMRSKGWDVYLNGKLIDTVFFDVDCDKDYVYRALVEHDGYPPGIEVR